VWGPVVSLAPAGVKVLAQNKVRGRYGVGRDRLSETQSFFNRGRQEGWVIGGRVDRSQEGGWLARELKRSVKPWELVTLIVMKQNFFDFRIMSREKECG
jgi:hypothetical protein